MGGKHSKERSHRGGDASGDESQVPKTDLTAKKGTLTKSILKKAKFGNRSGAKADTKTVNSSYLQVDSAAKPSKELSNATTLPSIPVHTADVADEMAASVLGPKPQSGNVKASSLQVDCTTEVSNETSMVAAIRIEIGNAHFCSETFDPFQYPQPQTEKVSTSSSSKVDNIDHTHKQTTSAVAYSTHGNATDLADESLDAVRIPKNKIEKVGTSSSSKLDDPDHTHKQTPNALALITNENAADLITESVASLANFKSENKKVKNSSSSSKVDNCTDPGNDTPGALAPPIQDDMAEFAGMADLPPPIPNTQHEEIMTTPFPGFDHTIMPSYNTLHKLAPLKHEDTNKLTNETTKVFGSSMTENEKVSSSISTKFAMPSNEEISALALLCEQEMDKHMHELTRPLRHVKGLIVRPGTENPSSSTSSTSVNERIYTPTSSKANSLKERDENDPLAVLTPSKNPIENLIIGEPVLHRASRHETPTEMMIAEGNRLPEITQLFKAGRGMEKVDPLPPCNAEKETLSSPVLGSFIHTGGDMYIEIEENIYSASPPIPRKSSKRLLQAKALKDIEVEAEKRAEITREKMKVTLEAYEKMNSEGSEKKPEKWSTLDDRPQDRPRKAGEFELATRFIAPLPKRRARATTILSTNEGSSSKINNTVATSDKNPNTTVATSSNNPNVTIAISSNHSKPNYRFVNMSNESTGAYETELAKARAGKKPEKVTFNEMSGMDPVAAAQHREKSGKQKGTQQAGSIPKGKENQPTHTSGSYRLQPQDVIQDGQVFPPTLGQPQDPKPYFKNPILPTGKDCLTQTGPGGAFQKMTLTDEQYAFYTAGIKEHIAAHRDDPFVASFIDPTNIAGPSKQIPVGPLPYTLPPTTPATNKRATRVSNNEAMPAQDQPRPRVSVGSASSYTSHPDTTSPQEDVDPSAPVWPQNMSIPEFLQSYKKAQPNVVADLEVAEVDTAQAEYAEQETLQPQPAGREAILPPSQPQATTDDAVQLQAATDESTEPEPSREEIPEPDSPGIVGLQAPYGMGMFVEPGFVMPRKEDNYEVQPPSNAFIEYVLGDLMRQDFFPAFSKGNEPASDKDTRTVKGAILDQGAGPEHIQRPLAAYYPFSDEPPKLFETVADAVAWVHSHWFGLAASSGELGAEAPSADGLEMRAEAGISDPGDAPPSTGSVQEIHDRQFDGGVEYVRAVKWLVESFRGALAFAGFDPEEYDVGRAVEDVVAVGARTERVE